MPETAGNEPSIAIGKLFQIQGSEPTNTKGPVEERAFTLMVSNDGERPFLSPDRCCATFLIDAS
ncbi:hypothetical protein ACHWUR_09275 [Klebsiella pneumoniae]